MLLQTAHAVYQADAFAVPASSSFTGNAAAVVSLAQESETASWPSDSQLVAFANEMQQSETAFVQFAYTINKSDADGDDADTEAVYLIRWFTPTNEVGLCGHATLAAGAVLLRNELHAVSKRAVHFQPADAGLLSVIQASGEKQFALRLPVMPPVDVQDHIVQSIASEATLAQAVSLPHEHTQIRSMHAARDLIVELGSEADVEAAKPNVHLIKQLPYFALCITAAAADNNDEHDFVSRFFAPRQGLDEDGVTGSAHCSLAPLWESKLGKAKLRALQLSKRRGLIDCTVEGGDGVTLKGFVTPVFSGTLQCTL